MATPIDDRLSFPALARQRGRVDRQIAAGALTRLAAEAPGLGPLDVALTFRMDDQGRPWVAGSAKQTVNAVCQGCLDERPYVLDVAFDLCMLPEGAAAQAAAERHDVLIVEGESVAIADIVEDELLLALPERLCEALPCPHAPAVSFPAQIGRAEGGRPRGSAVNVGGASMPDSADGLANAPAGTAVDGKDETSPMSGHNPFGVLAALKRADS